MPGIGAEFEHDHPALAGVRFFPVSRFRNYLVFYRPVADGIEVIRVVHGARDIDTIFREELVLDADGPDDDEADEFDE